jgi:outer membrane protein OmpA-like peptidoglycan-associated protein
MLANSYSILNNSENAKKWFLKSYELGGNPEDLKSYAFKLKELEEYDEAAKAFEDLIAQTGDAFLWRKEVAACNQAKAWKKNAAEKSEFKLNSETWNSNAADYSPTVYKNNQLIFISDRTSSTGDEKYKWTGQDFSDLFIKDENGKVTAFDAAFNSPYNEGPITFNQDFTEAYFSRCGSGDKSGTDDCKIMFAEFNGTNWSKPAPLKEVMIENTNYSYPMLSADGETLYFSTDILDGFGGFDIYYAKRTETGWDLPENVGSSINTEGNEIAPHLDNDTLYFASDFHVGMGGLDVFKTFKSRAGRWSPLQNLKAPINSGADDFGYIVDYQSAKEDTVLQVGYLTSNRNGTDDIFKFSKVVLPPEKVIPPPVEEIIDTTPVVVNDPFRYILEIKTIASEYVIQDDPSSGVVGKTALPNTTIQITVGNESITKETNENGELEIDIELGKFYNIFGSKSGYLNNSNNFSSRDIKKDENKRIRRFKVELELNKVIKGKEFTLENIYYDFSKYEIREDAKPTLDMLVRMLRENPETKIQLSSHTDCRGNDAYNEWLSQKRAESAVNYLIEKGVDVDRLTAKGYGETRPTNTCSCNNCSEEEHQANRRTTFTIL